MKPVEAIQAVGQVQLPASGSSARDAGSNVNGTSVQDGSSFASNDVQDKAANTKQNEMISTDELSKVVSRINKALEALGSSAQYQVVQKNNQDIVELVDKESKRILYQTPPEGLLAVAGKMQEMVGMVIDQRL